MILLHLTRNSYSRPVCCPQWSIHMSFKQYGRSSIIKLHLPLLQVNTDTPNQRAYKSKFNSKSTFLHMGKEVPSNNLQLLSSQLHGQVQRSWQWKHQSPLFPASSPVLFTMLSCSLHDVESHKTENTFAVLGNWTRQRWMSLVAVIFCQVKVFPCI